MKKFGKFLTSTAVVAGLAAGAYYVYKNFIADNTDEVEDIDEEEYVDEEATEEEPREYVSINIAGAADETADIPEDTEEVEPVSDPE